MLNVVTWSMKPVGYRCLVCRNMEFIEDLTVFDNAIDEEEPTKVPSLEN
jgi:hypothetical protein